MGDEIYFLIYGAYAQSFGSLWRAGQNLTPIESNRAGFGWMHAGDGFDEGALPGAVLTHQGMDLSASDGEVHSFQSLNTGKAFSQPANLKQRRGGPARSIPGIRHRTSVFTFWKFRQGLGLLENAFLNRRSFWQLFVGHDRLDGIE
jgi:hypothetical protein